ncbi:MAG: glycerate kinase [Sedimentisphaerales bacterium]|nr:glycerate kinase [Sedimentisphaerales bacterium]
MKIVVAIDSFKGSLTAMQACETVAAAIRSMMPEAQVVTRPMADGGEGTASVLMAAAGGEWVARTAMGPLPDMRVDAGFVWLPDDQAALVEMATAAGLHLLRAEQRNPLYTTTYGVGQLIKAAVDYGARRVLLAVGGSATVDGGVGAATALGWEFLAANGREIGLGGGELGRIWRIVPPERGLDATVEVLCDVDNPLCGEHGAARVYGPQKGATPEMVTQLDAALAHLATVVKEQSGRDIAEIPGAGAAGGLAAGAIAFMNARLVCGVDAVMAQAHLQEAVTGADWVITGEGSFDGQSLHGKVVSGVLRAAKAAGTKVGILAGQVRLSPREYQQAGVEAAVSCMEDRMDLEYAIAHAQMLLDRAARRFVRANMRSGVLQNGN